MSLVSLAVAKSWSKIYFTESDDEAQMILDAAEEHVKDFLGAALTTFLEDADSPATLNPAIKVCVCQLFDELWQNRSVTITGAVNTESPMWQRIAHFKRTGLGV